MDPESRACRKSSGSFSQAHRGTVRRSRCAAGRWLRVSTGREPPAGAPKDWEGRTMYGRAIPQIDADGKGIHVLWFGPTRWGYSPFGWIIERRAYSGPKVEPVCNSLNSNDI